MKAADLRKSILQAAVQGRLVPQNKNDEPASELLNRIQAEKAVLIKAGKLKKEKPLSPIMEDNVPYDLPEGWVWCHLGDLGDVQSSKRVFTSEFVDNGIPFYRGTEIGALSNGKVLVTKYYISEKHYHDLIQHTGKPIIGDLLMPSICPDGRIWLVDTDKPFYFKDGRVLWVRLIENSFNNQYIQQALKARFLDDYSSIASGTTFAELKIFSLKEVVIPLPPLSEQHRIIAKVDELMALCDELEAAEKEQDILEKHLAEDLPKSILQAAVQGKLVPQDKDDEPASELFKRVQVEKAALIKAGKLKKEKPLPPITEDEIPYDLPEGWTWCRIGDVHSIIRGITFPSAVKSKIFKEGLVQCATTGSVQQDYNESADVYVPEKFVKRKEQWLIPKDIIMSTANSRELVGKTCLWYGNDKRAFGGFLTTLRACRDMDAMYSYYAFKNMHAIGALSVSSTQTTNIANISNDILSKTLFPLPPFAEQQRIVAKVNELMSLCDELKHAYDQPVPLDNVIPLSTVNESDAEDEPLQMAAQGKINAQPSPKHADALRQLQGMMQDE